MDYKITGCVSILAIIGWFIYSRRTIEGGRWKKLKKQAKKRTNKTVGHIKQDTRQFIKKPVEKCYICHQPGSNDGTKQFCKKFARKKQILEDSIYDTTSQLDKLKESLDDSSDANYDIPGLIVELDFQTNEMLRQSMEIEKLIDINNKVSGYLEKNNVIYDETNGNLQEDNQLLKKSNEIYM